MLFLLVVLFTLLLFPSRSHGYQSEKDIKILFLQAQIHGLKKQIKTSRRLPHIHQVIMAIISFFLSDWKNICIAISPKAIISLRNNLFKAFWRFISKPKGRIHQTITQEIIDIIEDMAETTAWGAERIHGELLKLGIDCAKRTIQKYINKIKRPHGFNPGGNWQIFIKNHLSAFFATDFTTITNTVDFLHPFQIMFVISLHSRKIIHFNVSLKPDREWIIKQLKEATPFLNNRFYLIHDNDTRFTCINYQELGITPVRTAFMAPNMNAHMERFMRTVKHDCLNHFLFLSEKHLRQVLREFIRYYNSQRPHQGIDQQIPDNKASPITVSSSQTGNIKKVPVLNGLHYHYYREAA